MLTPAYFASLLVASIGVLIVWSNPSRSVNRAVFVGTLQMAAWLASWHMAATSSRGLFWLKWTCAIGALGPLNFWLVKEAILSHGSRFGLAWIGRNWAWFVCPAALAIIPFTESFIPAHSTKAVPVYGWGYYGYMWGCIALYCVLFRNVFTGNSSLDGMRRLELQVWLGGGCVLAVTIYLLMGLSALTLDPNYRRLQPLAVLLFYAGTAYAVTSHRIFDARQILLVSVEKIILVASVTGAVYVFNAVFSAVLTSGLALILTTVLGLWFAAILDGWLDHFFKFYPQATAARQAVLAAAGRERRLDSLEHAFLSVLKGWGQTENAIIFFGAKENVRSKNQTIEVDGTVLTAMRRLRWVTPERLAREKLTPDRERMARFLAELRLGVLVHGDGPSLMTLVGVGAPASRRPYTYPQVAQLMELASIIDGALERAHLSMKAQHAEQLATVGLLGASLAHEIRNPLVSIKTFVQLLPTHHQNPAFREKFFQLIGDEVSRIDQLTEQLLDLASPRAYMAQMIELHPILRASLDLVAAKAAHRSIEFLIDFQAAPDIAYTDASAAKQVMLNLCFNAIQAVESQPQQRWIKVATRNTAEGVEMAVADSGPGIPPEIRPQLFQPFQTTKSSGFGLGLAICSDILANLHASITVDPPTDGCGATFRVTFPCQPLLS